MIESGVKILGLDIIEDLDGIYFPAETVAEGTGRVSWDALKADIAATEWDELLFGKYIVENLKIDTGDPDDGMYELHIQNGDATMPHTIVTIENPSTATAAHEATLSQLIKSATRTILHDSALMDYSTTGMFYRIKNFSDAEYLGWEWDSYARVGGVMTKFIAATLDGAGIFTPKGGYKSADGSAGVSGTFTSANGKTITIKNGIVTSIV